VGLLVTAETYECPEGYARCYASRQCSLDYFFCDGEDDCDVGTDEDPAVCCMYGVSLKYVRAIA